MGKKQNKATLENRIIETVKQHKPETVKELINLLLQQDNKLFEQQAISQIFQLHADGKISFTQQQLPTPKNLTKHLEKAYWYWIIVSTSILAAIIVFTVPENLYPFIYLRYILGTVFVMLLPGYSLLRILFPTTPRKTSEKTLDPVERIALSIGVSLALVPLVGLILNYTPFGIRLTLIVLILLTLTILFATAATVREYWLSHDQKRV